MSSHGYIALAILALFFSWAVWAGWTRSMFFSSWHGAWILCIVSGFGLGYFLRATWEIAKILWWKG